MNLTKKFDQLNGFIIIKGDLHMWLEKWITLFNCCNFVLITLEKQWVEHAFKDWI